MPEISMKKTRHISARCQQRGIKERDLDLIFQYGTSTSCGQMLTGRDIAEAEKDMKRVLSRLSRLKNVFIPTDGETMITAFRANRSQRRRQVGIW